MENHEKEKKIDIKTHSANPAENNKGCSLTMEKRKVRGNSMEPLIHDDDTVEIIQNLKECHTIERNDVVIYNYSGHDTPLIKTVKGVPGDNFSLKKIESRNRWQIMINGQPLKNSAGKIYAYDNIEMLSLYAEDYPTIPAKTYLLLADNPGAQDSTKFGLVSRDDIIGVTNRSYNHPQTHK